MVFEGLIFLKEVFITLFTVNDLLATPNTSERKLEYVKERKKSKYGPGPMA